MFHSLMLTKCLVCILHAGLYIIKYLYILNYTSEIDFKFEVKVFRENDLIVIILIWSHGWCMFYRPGYKYLTDWCVN